MNRTKQKLRDGETVLGGWTLLGHPGVVEIMAGEGFDFVVADMEHTAIGLSAFHDIALAVKGTGCDLLARLQSCDPNQAKRVLDLGAHGIIVPSVNSAETAACAVAMAKFPPEGIRGASLCRATDYGRSFTEYFASHNDGVLVVVMLEHVDAVENIDAILSTPGIDATLIGPYDLSASIGLAGQVNHPNVAAIRQKFLDACKQHDVSPGLHVVGGNSEAVTKATNEGFRFVACGLDTLFLMDGCRAMLKGARKSG